ncbi:hypothetical protein [Streptosporangium longisporum]|uniref:hypothetical protein n=1 Tax=Streptosporangium longisporum TaxID=46187 RepID=UPI0031E5D937
MSPPGDRTLPEGPVVPGAPPWQPPPAFTAAAAGMQVWPAAGQEASPWPAATGEPVWSDPEESPGRPGEPGDVAVWPPEAVSAGETDETTADVRGAVPGASGRAGSPAPAVPAVPAEFGRAGARAPGTPDAVESPALPAPEGAGRQAPGTFEEPGRTGAWVPGPAPADQGASALHGPAPRQEPPAAPPLPPGPLASAPPAPSAPVGSPAGSPGASSAPVVPPVTPPMFSPMTPPVTEPGAQSPVPPLERSDDQDTEQVTRPRTARPSLPVPPPPPVDEATPPGGIPIFPALPAVPAQADGPQTGTSPGDPATARGPFTPLSEFTPEPPPTPPAPSRSRASTLLLAAVVSVVVIGIGIGAFFAYRSFSADQSATAANPIPTPGEIDTDNELNITSEPEPVNTTVLNSEKTDPGTVKVSDAFVKKVTLDGTTFTRVKTDVTERCQKAAAGKFADTLRDQDCRRVLRATYVDGKRRYAVTTGIAVLPTRESAIAADRAKKLDDNLWFRGLPAAAGSGAERVHIAGGYAAGMVWGRYIVFSYATFSDGHTPTAKEKTLAKVSGAFRDQTAKVVERRVTS